VARCRSATIKFYGRHSIPPACNSRATAASADARVAGRTMTRVARMSSVNQVELSVGCAAEAAGQDRPSRSTDARGTVGQVAAASRRTPPLGGSSRGRIARAIRTLLRTLPRENRARRQSATCSPLPRERVSLAFLARLARIMSPSPLMRARVARGENAGIIRHHARCSPYLSASFVVASFD